MPKSVEESKRRMLDEKMLVLRNVAHKEIVKHKPSPHQTHVYALAQLVPPGKVTTYGAIARVLASAPRAVGQALKTNPFAPTVPCHRVISSQGTTGGFQGEAENKHGDKVLKKVDMLRKEGVPFPTASPGKNREKLDEKYVLGAQDLMKLAHEHLKLQKKARDEAEAGF